MAEPTTKAEVMDLIVAERKLFDAGVAALSEEQLLSPALDNGRTVKDQLVHITAWEQKMLLWLAQSYRGETPDRPAPGEAWDNLDELNEQIYQENKNQPLENVLAASHSSYETVLAAIEVMPEADLFDADRFAWRRSSPMVNLVAGNTWVHYEEHRQEIERAFPV